MDTLTYVFIEDGIIVGKILAANEGYPVKHVKEWRDSHRPNAVIAVVVSQERGIVNVPVLNAVLNAN